MLAVALYSVGVLSGVLPPNTEEFDEKKGQKKITEYKYNEDGKILKVCMSPSAHAMTQGVSVKSCHGRLSGCFRSCPVMTDCQGVSVRSCHYGLSGCFRSCHDGVSRYVTVRACHDGVSRCVAVRSCRDRLSGCFRSCHDGVCPGISGNVMTDCQGVSGHVMMECQGISGHVIMTDCQGVSGHVMMDFQGVSGSYDT